MQLIKLVMRQMARVSSRPLNLILASVLAVVLGFGAATSLSGDGPISFDLSGRMFLLVSGLAAILGYGFAFPLRTVAKDASKKTGSLRTLAFARVLSSTLYGTLFAWLGGLVAMATASVQSGALALPVAAVGFFSVVGPILLAAAFSGATILAGFTANRVVRAVVRWGLFFPGVIALIIFRSGGAASMITSQTLTYTLLIAALVCAAEVFFLLQLVPDQQVSVE